MSACLGGSAYAFLLLTIVLSFSQVLWLPASWV